MSRQESRIIASIGSYTDKSGRARRITREIGTIIAHSDGSRYIAMDPFFNLAACPRKPGSDKVFLSIEPIEEG